MHLTSTQRNGLPRSGIPVAFHRFELGSVPKRRRRGHEGRSNRLTDDINIMHEMEHEFIAKPTLAIGARQVLGGFQSTTAVKQMTTQRRATAGVSAARPCGRLSTDAVNIMSERPVCERGIHPPVSPPLPTPAARLATMQRRADAEVHPAVASMLRTNRFGKGHQVGAENFFLDGVSTAYTAPCDSRHDTYRKPLPVVHRTLPMLACGGGILEYNHPRKDIHCRNPVVARFNIQCEYPSQPTEQQQKIVAPWSGVEEEADRQFRCRCCGGSYCHRVAEQRIGSTGFAQDPDIALSSEERPTECGSSPYTRPSSTFSGSEGLQQGPQLWERHRSMISDCSANTFSTDRGATWPSPQDAWITNYTPSAKPYQVEPWRGRCGYSDFRLTFHRVQAERGSALFLGEDERFVTTKQIPLDTPNGWQLKRGGRQRCVLHMQSTLSAQNTYT